jgi:hypothetical protein
MFRMSPHSKIAQEDNSVSMNCAVYLDRAGEADGVMRLLAFMDHNVVPELDDVAALGVKCERGQQANGAGKDRQSDAIRQRLEQLEHDLGLRGERKQGFFDI